MKRGHAAVINFLGVESIREQSCARFQFAPHLPYVQACLPFYLVWNVRYNRYFQSRRHTNVKNYYRRRNIGRKLLRRDSCRSRLIYRPVERLRPRLYELPLLPDDSSE